MKDERKIEAKVKLRRLTTYAAAPQETETNPLPFNMSKYPTPRHDDDDSSCQHCKKMLTRQKRVSTKQKEEHLRKAREKFGLPSPADIWLAAKLAQGTCADGATPLAPSEVTCTTCIERIPEPEPSKDWVDDDTFVLHLTIVSAARNFEEGCLQSERRVVLGQYTGDPESIRAPDWVSLPAGKAMVFRESAAAVSELLLRTSLGGSELMPLQQSLSAVRLEG
ncbi:hypothetical protein BD414DRAFT_494218 [Trametes punicea]|nr:hypothetical protein BD414DRAFT_494218 [Trametes punicea]